MRAMVLLSFVSALLTFGCASQKRQASNENDEFDQKLLSYTGTNVILQIMSADCYLTEEHKRNHVPGASKNIHGSFDKINFDILHIGSTPTNTVPLSEMKFPFSWTFHFIPDGTEALTNHYTVGRIKNDSPWHLLRAWQTGADGKIVKEWPIDK